MAFKDNLKIFTAPILLLIVLVAVVYLQFFSQPSKIQIVYDSPLNSLNPFTYSDFNTSRLNYIYESLISYDQNLNLLPVLATSYGKIDPLTVEFKLKPNVKFHNDADLTSRNIKEIIEVLKTQSNLSEILNTFESIEVIDDLTFRLILNQEDPFVFHKFTLIPIAKFQKIDNLEIAPNGTGYYKFVEQTDNKIALEINQNYHSTQPDFKFLDLVAIPEFAKRIEYANIENQVVALYGVSPETQILNLEKFQILNNSDQSSNFILFNYGSKLAKDKSFQDTFYQIFKSIDFEVLTSSIGKNTNQFLAKGVFGYNPNIDFELQSLKDLKDSAKIRKLQGKEISLAIPAPFSKFQIFLNELFQTLNLSVTIQPLEFAEYNQEKLADFDLIMFGFKADFADGTSFYNAFSKSDSKLNFSQYSNPKIDQILEELKSIEDENQKIQKLQTLAELVNQKRLGIPLFENQNYYALSKDFSLKTRLDGLIDIKFLKAK